MLKQLIALVNLNVAVSFGDLNLQPPDAWVDEHFIGNIEPHFVAFVSALAGILAIKSLFRL